MNSTTNQLKDARDAERNQLKVARAAEKNQQIINDHIRRNEIFSQDKKGLTMVYLSNKIHKQRDCHGKTYVHTISLEYALQNGLKKCVCFEQANVKEMSNEERAEHLREQNQKHYNNRHLTTPKKSSKLILFKNTYHSTINCLTFKNNTQGITFISGAECLSLYERCKMCFSSESEDLVIHVSKNGTGHVSRVCSGPNSELRNVTTLHDWKLCGKCQRQLVPLKQTRLGKDQRNERDKAKRAEKKKLQAELATTENQGSPKKQKLK